MCDAFCQYFTTCCGVNKIKVIHKIYPQAVYNSGEKKRFAEKSCYFPCFLQQKQLFSVDNSVHTVYKSVKSTKS
jgi:hypothetical protein